MRYDVVCYYRKDLDQFSIPVFVPSLAYSVEEVSSMLREKARSMLDGSGSSDFKSDLDLVPFLELVKIATYDSDKFKFEKTHKTRVALYSDLYGLKEVYDNYVRKMAESIQRDKASAE